jgi:hypothetical protein
MAEQDYGPYDPENPFKITGSSSVPDLRDPKRQVPPPPTEETADQLRNSLNQANKTLADLTSGYGNTRGQYGTRIEFEQAKIDAQKTIDTLAPQVAAREQWESKWRVWYSQKGAFDKTVMSADEVYQQQQYIKAATNKNDKELVAYDKAVTDYFTLKKKLESKSSKVPAYEKNVQLMVAAAKVQAATTDRVLQFRSQPLVVSPAVEGVSQEKVVNYTSATKQYSAPSDFVNAIGVWRDAAYSAASDKLSSVEVTRDEYGRPKTSYRTTTQTQLDQLKAIDTQLSAFVTGSGAAPSVNPFGTRTPTTPPIIQPRPTADRAEAAAETAPPAGSPAAEAMGRRQVRAAGAPPVIQPGRVGAPGTATAGQTAGFSTGTPGTTVPGVTVATGTTGAGTTGGGTTGSGTTGGGTTGSGATAMRRNPNAWKDALQQFFPSYAATFTLEEATKVFGQDLIDLMVKVSDPNSGYDMTTSAGVERVKAELRGTSYWRTTVEAARNFDQMTDGDRSLLTQQTKSRIASTYGDLNLDEATLNDISKIVARNGLTGVSEQQAIYTAIFRRGASPTGVRSALMGEEANALRKLGKAYGYDVSDDQIQSILSGTPDIATGQTLTEDSLRQRMRAYVKGAMPHLSEQIDAGLTLDDVGASYKRFAAQLLERDENQIDMMSGPYVKAFGTPKEGQMSLSDWITTVKSDPTFGWQYTKQANDQATNIALSLARVFGKVG